MLNIKWDDKGLVAAIIQDSATGEVLMLGYMDAEALKQTLESGHAWFWSRSRQELWHKGATSGNYLKVKEVWYDCDADAVLVKAHPIGPTCHTGERSCFFRRLNSADL
ncbi:MAG: phosphoribosyl-AMP cyclohydrolase [Dehalococcoidia bacterium]|nr:phosphoribosyl-AMP cyclohydrolase [Dehalococcoidia bacterium]